MNFAKSHKFRDIYAFEVEENPWRFLGDRDDPMTPSELSFLEEKHGIQLPEEYRYFLQEYGAGDFGSGYVWSPDEESEWSLWSNFDVMPENQGKVIPFSGGDGLDVDFYAFVVSEFGVVGEEVVEINVSHPTIFGKTKFASFFDFLIKECLYPIKPV